MANAVDYDAIVIGGGPAGLSAGGALSKAGKRVLLLEKESFGGQLMKMEWIHGYPNTGDRITGVALAASIADDARDTGLHMEQGEVVEIETYSRCRSVVCADGRAYTCKLVIFAGGLDDRPLGIPGEADFQGRGVTHCALCDAALYSGQSVAVVGGGNAAVLDALYFANHAAKVFLVDMGPELTAMPALIERIRGNAKVEVRGGVRPIEIIGTSGVTGLVVADRDNQRETLSVTCVLARYAFDPATSYVSELLPLDDQGHIVVDSDLLAGSADLLAAGDIRHDSPRSVATAVSDGLSAAAAVLILLDKP